MDAAPLLWAVLGVALLSLVVLVVALLAPSLFPGLAAARRRRTSAPRPAAATSPAYVVDDLPGFASAPPGTPGATPPATRASPARGAAGDTAGPPPARRVLLAMTAAALVLLGVLAVVAMTTRDSTTADRDGDAAPSTTARRVPELPPVPPAPTPGEPGAGGLAFLSVPLDAGGWAGRLAFAPLVLERRAVGTTVTSPAVGVTQRAGGTALAHVRLPTWNCLAAEAPADPAAAGCVPGPTEYADLPSPALATEAEDDVLRLTGRFSTYTRPNGGPPVYTGRVYELTVSLEPAEPAERGSWGPARGTLFLGTDRTESVPDRRLSAVLRAG